MVASGSLISSDTDSGSPNIFFLRLISRLEMRLPVMSKLITVPSLHPSGRGEELNATFATPEVEVV